MTFYIACNHVVVMHFLNEILMSEIEVTCFLPSFLPSLLTYLLTYILTYLYTYLLTYLSVNHEILLNKLTHYGIRGQAVNWFRSFLSQKVQYTSVCGFDSKLCLVTHGVPLGSVLRPLLWIISINDLHKSVRHDDTNLLYSNKTIKNQQTHKLSSLLLFNGSDHIGWTWMLIKLK